MKKPLIKLLFKAQIRLRYDKLSKDCLKEIIETFTYKNQTYITNMRLHLPILGIPMYLKSYRLIKKKRILSISRGCLKRLIEILTTYNYKTRVIDKTIFSSGLDVVYRPKVELREDQQKAVRKAINSSHGGLIKAPTSFGKTLCSLSIIAKLGKQANVIVWSRKHQQQWYDEILKFKFLKKEDIGGVGGIFKTPKVGKINIIMQQSIATIVGRDNNTLKLFKDIPVVFADEGQKFSAKTFNAVINKLNGKYRFSVSADFSRSDKKEFLIYNTFGKYIFIGKDKKSDSKIPAVVNLVTTQYRNSDYLYDRKRYALLADMVIHAPRNKIIIQRAIKKINEKKLVLIMVEYKDHAARLAIKLKNYKVKLLLGTTSRKTIENYNLTEEQKDILRDYNPDKEYKEVLKLAETKDIDVIIGTSITFVGLSIKTLDHAIIATPSSRDLKLFNQKVGRVERSYGNDSNLLKLFGKKQTPTIDYIADMEVPPLASIAYEIKSTYNRKVRFIKGY